METKLFLLLNRDFASLDMSLQEEVYRDFYHLVYSIAVYMTKDHAAAEDIVQEAFIKTIFKAPPMENEQQLRAWIKAVTKNLTLNVLRKNKKICNSKKIEYVLDNKENNYAESAEKEVESKILEHNIYKSLAEINSDYRMLIELRWIEDKSNKAISQQLDLPEDTVKQKLHRARKALKKKLLKWGFRDE